jgi:hypothetical protein
MIDKKTVFDHLFSLRNPTPDMIVKETVVGRLVRRRCVCAVCEAARKELREAS